MGEYTHGTVVVGVKCQKRAALRDIPPQLIQGLWITVAAAIEIKELLSGVNRQFNPSIVIRVRQSVA